VLLTEAKDKYSSQIEELKKVTAPKEVEFDTLEENQKVIG